MPEMKTHKRIAEFCLYRCIFALVVISSAVPAHSQSAAQSDASTTQSSSRLAGSVFNLLNMAGTEKSKQFHPLTQAERKRLYFNTMINPLSFARCAFSAGIDQWNDKPFEWEQGASGYGKRFANILG